MGHDRGQYDAGSAAIVVDVPASGGGAKNKIKARWVCETAHQQLKHELGLGHFEGRSWHGLHHHAVLSMIAFAFLEHMRSLENKA